jgi:N-methylhydantoinase A
VVGSGLRDGSPVPRRVTASRPQPPLPPPRPVYFGAHGWIETPVAGRSDLAAARAGPLIIEEYDATCVIPPAARARLDDGGNIVIELR